MSIKLNKQYGKELKAKLNTLLIANIAKIKIATIFFFRLIIGNNKQMNK